MTKLEKLREVNAILKEHLIKLETSIFIDSGNGKNNDFKSNVIVETKR